MRRKFNGFDILVAALVVIGLLLLARRALHHTGTLTAQRTVVFTVTSLPTQNASAIASHLTPGGQVTVSAAGTFIPLGTMQSFRQLPYRSSVPVNGKLVPATDPLEGIVQITVVAKAAVSHQNVTINGNPFLVGQQTIFQEGGSQFTAIISDEQVR